MANTLQTKRLAIIATDFINDIVNLFPSEIQNRILENAKKILNYARKKDYLVVYTRVALSEGYPEWNSRNIGLGDLSHPPYPGFLIDGQPGTKINEQITPKHGDIVIKKVRFSSFSTTDLQTLLISQNITDIVVFGVATSKGVLSTVSDAGDKDYKITVISDACADPNSEANNSLMKFIFPRQARVISTDQFINDN